MTRRTRGTRAVLALLALALGCTPRTSSRSPSSGTPGDDFERAVEAYRAAVTEGRLVDECDSIAARFERIAAHDPDRAAIARLDAAAVRAECGQRDQATALLRRISEQSQGPARARAENGLAALASAEGAMDEAWAHLERAAQADPSWSLPRNNQRRLVFAMLTRTTEDRWPERGEELVAHLEASGHPVEAQHLRLKLMVTALPARSSPQAEQLVLGAIAEALQHPDLSDAQASRLLVLQGEVHLASGNMREAVGDLRSAIERDPGQGEAYADLAIIAGRLRDFESVAILIEQALRDPALATRVHLHVMQAVALGQLRRFVEADQALARAGALTGGDPGAEMMVERARQTVLDERLDTSDFDLELLEAELAVANRLLVLLERTEGRSDLSALRSAIDRDIPRRQAMCSHFDRSPLCAPLDLPPPEQRHTHGGMERLIQLEAEQRAKERERLLELERRAIEEEQRRERERARE